MNHDAPNTCERAQELALTILDSETLQDGDQDFLDQHMLACGDCRAYQRTMSNLAGSFGALAEVPVPAGLDERIMGRIEQDVVQRASHTQTGMNRFGWRKTIPIAAAVLLLALAVPMLNKHLHPGPSASNLAQKLPVFAIPETVQPIAANSETNQPNPAREQVFATTQPDIPIMTTRRRQTVDTERAGERNVLAYGGQQASTFRPTDVRAVSRQAVTPLSQPPEQSESQPQSTAPLEVAMASTDVQSAVASEGESDVYYDPVSTLVGF